MGISKYFIFLNFTQRFSEREIDERLIPVAKNKNTKRITLKTPPPPHEKTTINKIYRKQK